jgi:hypothetical protein
MQLDTDVPMEIEETSTIVKLAVTSIHASELVQDLLSEGDHNELDARIVESGVSRTYFNTENSLQAWCTLLLRIVAHGYGLIGHKYDFESHDSLKISEAPFSNWTRT